MQLRITIAICMVEIRNRKTLQSKVNICKSDVKIGDYADSLAFHKRIFPLHHCMVPAKIFVGRGGQAQNAPPPPMDMEKGSKKLAKRSPHE